MAGSATGTGTGAGAGAEAVTVTGAGTGFGMAVELSKNVVAGGSALGVWVRSNSAIRV